MSNTILNPVTGYSMTFLEVGDDLFRFSEIAQPGAPPPVLHVHPSQEEGFEVIRGRVAFKMGGQRVVCGPGEVVSVPAGVAHTFENVDAGESEMIGEYRPGLPAMSRRFHEVYFALARAGLTDSKGIPSILQMAVEMPFVSDHVRLASPPWPVQRVVLALLRPLARILGHRPFDLDSEPNQQAQTVPAVSSAR